MPDENPSRRRHLLLVLGCLFSRLEPPSFRPNHLDDGCSFIFKSGMHPVASSSAEAKQPLQVSPRFLIVRTELNKSFSLQRVIVSVDKDKATNNQEQLVLRCRLRKVGYGGALTRSRHVLRRGLKNQNYYFRVRKNKSIKINIELKFLAPVHLLSLMYLRLFRNFFL